jgi:hypothetical protein
VLIGLGCLYRVALRYPTGCRSAVGGVAGSCLGAVGWCCEFGEGRGTGCAGRVGLPRASGRWVGGAPRRLCGRPAPGRQRVVADWAASGAVCRARGGGGCARALMQRRGVAGGGTGALSLPRRRMSVVGGGEGARGRTLVFGPLLALPPPARSAVGPGFGAGSRFKGSIRDGLNRAAGPGVAGCGCAGPGPCRVASGWGWVIRKEGFFGANEGK